jgi:hypothetical protein
LVPCAGHIVSGGKVTYIQWMLSRSQSQYGWRQEESNLLSHWDTSSSSSLLIDRRPVYTSVSLHLFISRLRFLFPTGIPLCTLLTNRSSVIRDMCMLHSILLLCTQEVMFWISHISRILSFPILSIRVLFRILLSVFISVASNICVVLAVSARVSTA